ncbi:MAG: GNAT family N-acetyltransferase [Bacteroidales bacterium]|nr:GNAT family N-acetyltransferase [Bacteroidales bacterium]
MIRIANSGDLEAINDLLGQVLRVHHEGRPDLFRSQGKKYTDQEILDIFENPDSPVFVYEEDGKVLGYAFCSLEFANSGSLKPVKTLYLDDLCVDASARGRHIGTKLFEFVKAYAAEQGCYNLTLHVWSCNPSAQAFYEALGMQVQYQSMEIIL